ncbi:MAG: mannose-1-phosphate guanylyltransferase/mannose-6-phosphate isomerase [Coriobacteriia bacterium]|nr:mannose-1-phosphate guanylyltransferase/mannose-6-phosphate isomerase [Coriobacteriia bacterium]
MANLHAVILAGGSGSRFWPLSREMNPKQMLDVFGTESLLVGAVKRAASVCTGHAERAAGAQSHGAIWIVVGEALHDELRNHLKAHSELSRLDIRYVIEPCARNTAPALALAAATIKLKDPTAQIVMLPSDHICNDDDEWQSVIAAARTRAAAGDLVVIGLKPTAPITGYGYIKRGAEYPPDDRTLPDDSTPNAPSVYAVECFAEKPDEATAREYVQSGEYFWNSGMLVAGAKTIIAQLRIAGARYSGYGDDAGAHPAAEYSGKIASVAETLADAGPDAWKNDACRFLYADCPKVPFDTACLEVAEDVSVVAADLGWSDVGSLEALTNLQEPDEHGNTLIGRAVDVESHNTLSYAESGRVVATLGLKDVLVVDSADATLVAARERAQEVRRVVDALKACNMPEVAQSKTSLRPWGSWTMLVRMPGYHVKEITVLPGMRLSSQSHEHRAEHWIVAEGTALVTCNGGTITLHENESAFLPIGTVHRLENVGEGLLRVVEVATGTYLGEDDIVRYEDDYGRDSGSEGEHNDDRNDGREGSAT